MLVAPPPWSNQSNVKCIVFTPNAPEPAQSEARNRLHTSEAGRVGVGGCEQGVQGCIEGGGKLVCSGLHTNGVRGVCVGRAHRNVVCGAIRVRGTGRRVKQAANLALLLWYAAVCCCVRPERRYALPEDLYPGLKGDAARWVSAGVGVTEGVRGCAGVYGWATIPGPCSNADLLQF